MARREKKARGAPNPEPTDSGGDDLDAIEERRKHWLTELRQAVASEVHAVLTKDSMEAVEQLDRATERSLRKLDDSIAAARTELTEELSRLAEQAATEATMRMSRHAERLAKEAEKLHAEAEERVRSQAVKRLRTETEQLQAEGERARRRLRQSDDGEEDA